MGTIVKDFIRRVGKSAGGCTVYYIRPLGYWIAPKNITINREPRKHQATLRNVHSDNNIQIKCGKTSDDFIRAATTMLEHVDVLNGLWLTNSRIIDNPLTIQTKDDQYVVSIPKAIQEGKRRYHTTNRANAVKKALELRDVLRDRYHVTPEEALTFYNICPELRK